MLSRLLRAALILAAFALLFALAGCGSSHTLICPLTNTSGVCNCSASNNSNASSEACLAPAYLVASGEGTVSVYPINLSTGAVSSAVASTTGPSMSFGLAAVNTSNVYVSAPQVGGTSMIDAWAFNLANGALTTSAGFTLGTLSEPSAMAVDPAGPYLYVSDAGSVDVLQVGATGALTAISGSPFRSAGGGLFLAIDPQNRYVFTSVDQPNGYVSAATIDASTGALTAVGGSPFAIAPGGSTDTRPFEIAVDSTGNYVYVALEGSNQVAGFAIGTGGVLTQLPGSPYAAGNTPFTLATVNDLLYVSNAMDGTISGYSITTSTGVLVPLSGSPFAIHASAMTMDPNGRFLFASGAGGEIQVFTIEASSGALTPVTGSPFMGSPATVFEYVQ